MSLDFDFLEGHLELAYQSDDSSQVLQDYIQYVANKGLKRYKHKIQTGGKEGESLWTHIMNLVTTIERLRPILGLKDIEMRCLLLALTIHDLNKVEPYGISPKGRKVNYTNAASIKNIMAELEELKVDYFFSQWRDYLGDITYLAHAHQVGSPPDTMYDQRKLDQCKLEMERLEGPLNSLMKVADTADNSHSGNYMTYHEKHIRDKLLIHVNAALNEARYPRRYRFVGHRLAEQRGLMTNIIHNTLVTYFQETYGREACIDLLYHSDGVDYLLDKRIPLIWSRETIKTVAERVGKRFADLQFRQLAQFIKATPSGIHVDDAGMQSGASLTDIFIGIMATVGRKQYRQEWLEERNRLVRADLEASLHEGQTTTELKEHVAYVLRETDLVTNDDEALKRGEFVAAYRNFLKDHRTEQLKAIKQEAWERALRLFHLPEHNDMLYYLVDPYRRGYLLARDLPSMTLEEMTKIAIEDLDQLDRQAAIVMAARKAKKATLEAAESTSPTINEEMASAFDTAYLMDYLERHLEVWDSVGDQSGSTRPVQLVNFEDTLLRYADPKRSHKQCCYCGSALKADDWVAMQVPAGIGVQVFSNRLEGGSAREPMRNVCDVCRAQFILEKLAWRSHRDKQGKEQTTFYLHLFPYTYFTQPLLQAWWQSISWLRDRDHAALFLDTQDYFVQWETAYINFQGNIPDIPVRYSASSMEGVGIPTLSEALSNTPVLPLIVSGSNYGKQFMLALEKTVLLTHWFECRAILSRMPVPLLNLAQGYIDSKPIALLLENTPRAMSWLIPQTSLTRKDVDDLCDKLGKLHTIAKMLSATGESSEDIIYDLITAAADDPLALYYEADRYIERHATHKKGRKPEYQALELSRALAPLLHELMKHSVETSQGGL